MQTKERGGGAGGGVIWGCMITMPHILTSEKNCTST